MTDALHLYLLTRFSNTESQYVELMAGFAPLFTYKVLKPL